AAVVHHREVVAERLALADHVVDPALLALCAERYHERTLGVRLALGRRLATPRERAREHAACGGHAVRTRREPHPFLGQRELSTVVAARPQALAAGREALHDEAARRAGVALDGIERTATHDEIAIRVKDRGADGAIDGDRRGLDGPVRRQ